jgi:uncharacterized membrane protein YkoI
MITTNRSSAVLATLAAIMLAATPVAAQVKGQGAAAKHETEAQLKAEAKIAEPAARATALAKVPGGHVKKFELERENGKLLYSYDIATKGKSGIDEVQVDAITGSVIGSVQHENAAKEKAEAKAEAKEAKAAKKAENKKP